MALADFMHQHDRVVAFGHRLYLSIGEGTNDRVILQQHLSVRKCSVIASKKVLSGNVGLFEVLRAQRLLEEYLPIPAQIEHAGNCSLEALGTFLWA
jgi:hypothetical protein